MSLATKKSGLQIPDRMRNKLEKFQRKVWMIKLAEGLLAAAFGLLVSYLLVFALDRFMDTPAVARLAILIVGALGLGVWFPLVCHKWIWKSRQLNQVAKLLKYKFPRLGDHLLGIIELVNNHEEHSRSEALTRAALAQVDEETKDRDFSNAVPKPKHLQWALIAGVPAAIAVAALMLVPEAGTNAMARWLMPWTDTERYTFAQLDELPDNMVVPMAENSNLRANLSKDTKWSPDSGSAYVSGVRVRADQDEGAYGFKIPPLKDNSKLKVAIGDARKKIMVEPKERPELSSLVANIKLPDYLQRTESLEKDIRGGVVTMVHGSEVSFVGQATREIAEATADGKAIGIDGSSIITSPVSITDSRVMEFAWRDALGLTAKAPLKLKIRAEEDQEPSLICRRLEKQRVIMEKDVLQFEVDAQDDFGVKTIGMTWLGKVSPEDNYDAAKGEKVVSAGSPESTELTAVATFNPKRQKVKPQVLQLRLFTEDYLPDRERVYSPAYTVFVLSEEDHAIWLTRRMDEWFKNSLETYEREQQLFKENVRLRNMTPEELDTAQARRSIESQAAAEKAQGRRLGALTELGSELVQEATRNDQFNVATLEKMSEMLGALDEIAKDRMPSVAGLLKEAADAAASNGEPVPEGEPSEGESNSEKAPSVDDIKGTSDGEKGGKSEDDKPKVPSINMSESSMDKKEPDDEEAKDEDEDEEEQAGGGGAKFSLPGVQLKDNSKSEGGGGGSPAGQKMEEAVEAQEELLAEFQRVAEELKQIIQNLEGSTFVKRLKAMSRRHIELAQDINETTLNQFGESENKVKDATKERSQLLSKRETLHGSTLANIQDDLEAYVNRVNEGKFTTVLNEMKNDEVLKQVTDVSEKIVANESGGSIAHSEFLADTFDRWAEQLVGPG
jgi:hypothetical protein